MKNILILENSSKFYWGGGQQITMMVIKILKNKVPGLYLADYKSSMLFPKLASEYIDSSHRMRLYGVCYKNPITGKESRLLELLISFVLLPLNIFNILLFCKRNGLTTSNTVIYCITKKVLLIAYFLSLVTRYKYIYHSHMVVDGGGISGKLMQKELKRADMILCVSKTVYASIPCGNKILVYNALDSHKEIKTIDVEKFIVSVVGSIVPIKGFDVFVESYQYLKHKDIEYRIYGTGYLENDIKKRIEKMACNSIRMMGFHEDIFEALRDSKVLVVPTLIAESFSLVVLQSFLLGIPCVATNIGGQAENITDGKNGFLISVGDAKAIAEKIDYLYENPEIYRDMSVASHATYEKFKYERFERKIIDVFSKA